MIFKKKSWAAVLLSRQPLRPCGKTPWISGAAEAVSWVKSQGLGLLNSIGMQTWDLLVFLAKREEIPQIIVLPVANDCNFAQFCQDIKEEFGLEKHLTRFMALTSTPDEIPEKELLHARDRKIIDLADFLIPISVRPGGFMEESIRKKIFSSNVGVLKSFKIPYKKRQHKLGYKIKADKNSSAPEIIGDRYLIHWTRASNGPWPTENKFSFYRDMLNSEYYPRGAFDTLQNILKTRCIKASSLHMPLNIQTVSFSALAPADALCLMRWRSRYVQMSFEPYGIGVEKTFAKKYGILPVQYYKKGNLPNCERWLTQSTGAIGDWPREAEYRFRGDLDFSDIPNDKLAVFCLTPAESKYLREHFGFAAFSIWTCNKNL